MTFLLLDEMDGANLKPKEKNPRNIGSTTLWDGGKSVHSIFIDVRIDVRNKYIFAVSEPIYFIWLHLCAPRPDISSRIESGITFSCAAATFYNSML